MFFKKKQLNKTNHFFIFAKVFYRSRYSKNRFLNNIASFNQSDRELMFLAFYFLIFERLHHRRCFKQKRCFFFTKAFNDLAILKNAFIKRR